MRCPKLGEYHYRFYTPEKGYYGRCDVFATDDYRPCNAMTYENGKDIDGTTITVAKDEVKDFVIITRPLINRWEHSVEYDDEENQCFAAGSDYGTSSVTYPYKGKYISIIGRSTGSGDIIFRPMDLGNYTATIHVNVIDHWPVAVSKITIKDDLNGSYPLAGDEFNLTAVITPENADVKDVEWSSNDESIATIDEDGHVIAIAPGSVMFTATAKDDSGVTATRWMTIRKVSVTSLTLDKHEVSIYEETTATLTATVLPENATDKIVRWTSSNATVATVDQEGVVTGVATGTATIKVSLVADPTIFDECEVTVSKDPAGVNGVSKDDLRVLVVNRSIVVDGCTPGATLTLYTLSGLPLRETIAEDTRVNIESVPQGCYILKIGNLAVKVVIP